MQNSLPTFLFKISERSKNTRKFFLKNPKNERDFHFCFADTINQRIFVNYCFTDTLKQVFINLFIETK